MQETFPGFVPHIQSERQALRSDVGYAGLRNLSNTCYLNSLFSQLFMNLRFRDFIFAMDSGTDSSRQPLVHELSKLFASMQNRWDKYVDTTDVVACIETYDNEQIDVSIQMDVDEFFNLLFDRLEGQISNPGNRNTFRSLYGGQLVQQIKSRECDHISERLEPFSAIQCEIKGKLTLEDSLQAYVEGEVMQGGT
jgi:ubiquitin carboxyl-terminal hydrolase 34